MKGCLSLLIKITLTCFGIFLLMIFIAVITSDDHDNNKHLDYESELCKEYNEQLYNKNDLSYFKNIQRSWINYSEKDFCYNYSILNADKQSSYIDYENYEVKTNWSLANDTKFYGELYNALLKSDSSKLLHITDSLLNIAQLNKLNKKQTAEMIVTFVQDIPYSYVFGNYPCSEREDKNLPCVEGHRFGLLTPVEFLHSLVGDCDTRSVLLYLILKQLNYDLSIVVSREYAHAMIAINLPYDGDFITYNNKKYYFWETTATGWIPGALPPSCNNIDYWNVALI